MKYAKLVNEKLVFSRKTETIDGKFIINPTAEQLIELGYKEYIPSSPPSPVKWHATKPSYIESEGKILQQWEYIKEPEPDYKTLVVSRIREKYDIDDEISMNYKDDNDHDFITYREYVNECKIWAKNEINEWENS